MSKQNSETLPIYFVTLVPAGEGAIHHELPCWYLAAQHLPLIRLSPVAGESCLKEFFRESPGQIFLRSPFRATILGKIKLHLALIWELLKLRIKKKGVFYIYGSVCTPDIAIALAGLDGHRVIYHTQDFLEPARYPLRSRIERRIARKATLVVSNEVNRARFMQSYYGLTSMPLVVPTALPRDWPIPERSEAGRKEIVGERWTQNMKIVLHLGGYSDVRMGRFLLEAMSKMPDNYVLVFTGMRTGSQSSQECFRQAKLLGIQGRIIAASYLSFPKLLEYAVNSDVGILLYPNDGIGNFYQCPGRLTEYAACGLPFVTSDFPGLEHMVLKFGLGRACDPCCPAEIAQAIRLLVEVTPSDADSRREHIQRQFKEHLAYEQRANVLVEMIRSMLRAV